MKVDRRSFLSFVIGGAAGTALSPLPWKLLDDASIWSQGWPWTPVPLDGAVSYENSTCTLCPGGCGITIRKIDQRAVKIEGRPGHPINDGGICLRGLSGLQLLYGPTRVVGPLKRAGERGQGEWTQISWEQAISEVAEKLGGIRADGKPHTVAAICDTDRGTVPGLLMRFLTAIGSPNFIRTASIEDSQETALYLTQGVRGSLGYDLENADFVLSFGSGIIDGWGSPVRMIRANSLLKEKKATVVQIESRLSNTAAKSERWIPVNPGTEGDLALGLAHVIIRDERGVGDFIDSYTTGFEAFKKVVLEQYSPDQVAAVSGVAQGTIEELARQFSGASAPLAIYGRGNGRHIPGSLKETVAVLALNALVGNINRPGGVIAVPEQEVLQFSEMETDEVAAKGLQESRVDGIGSDTYPHARYLPHRLIQAAASGQPYAIQALLVANSNPCYALPDREAVKAAFDKIPFVVSFSSFMDETVMNADLVLPDHVYLERIQDLPVTAGLPRTIIGLVRPVVAPQFNTRHMGDTLIALAKTMGDPIATAFPWDDYESCLAENMGDKWDSLEEDGLWVDAEFEPSSWENGFETESGRFEFPEAVIKAIANVGPVTAQGEADDYPLLLIPYDTLRLSAKYIGDPPFMIKSVSDTLLKKNDGCIQINTQSAKAAGLTEGSAALLETPLGQARVLVHLSEGIMPGVLALPRGLGHTAYDAYLAGKGVNVNDLIGPVEDPVSGHDAAWGIRAKLTKAQA